jgi:ribokinase
VERLPLDGAGAALLNLETSMPAAVAFAQRAHDAGARVILNPAPAGDVPAELFALADVLIPNAREATALTGITITEVDDAFAAADALLGRGPDIVVITLGAHGAVCVGHGVRVHIPAFEVACIDAVGAGDAFCAAVSVALAEGVGLAETVRRANAAGSLAATVAGAARSMPGRAAVDALLAGRPAPCA